MTDSATASHSAGAEVRTPTQIDGIAEEWVVTLAELDPSIATWIGIPGRLDEYEDMSPAGHDRYIDEAKKVLAKLESAVTVDEVDWVTKTDLTSDLRLDIESSDAGLWMRDLNVIASPAQGIRDILDLMPTDTEQNWVDIAGRLRNLPAAIEGYIQTLRLGIETGITPAKRQVREVIDQARKHAATTGFFHGFAVGATLDGSAALPESLAEDLARGATASAAAYESLANFLADELMPRAQDQDGVGREVYALMSRRFLGATIDLDETYEWGIEELARMVEEQESIAHKIKSGASVAEAIEILDADPSRTLHGTTALKEWMQRLSDKAVDELSRSHFDIPDPVKRLECMIAPTQEGGIYYTSPSDDFSRAGRMWWSVPEGVTEFNTWRETTTV